MSDPVEMRVRYFYDANHHAAVLKPKESGAADIAQETANPTLIVTEVGTATFVGDVPPGFPPNNIEGVVLKEKIRTGLPVEDAAGQLICTVSWIRRILTSSLPAAAS